MSPTLHLVLNRTLTVGVFNINCISSTARLIVNMQIIDYSTANDVNLKPPLNNSQKVDLYAEFASGSESGWDFSSRWYAGSTSKIGGLLSLNIRRIIGPDLNSIICELSLLPKMMQDSNRGLICTYYRQEPYDVGRTLWFHWQYNCSWVTQSRC